MNSLRDKKVVIIGGSQGIGFETARMAYEKGAEVVIASRSLEKLKKAKSNIGEKIQIYQLDGSIEKQVCIFFSQVYNIDHLVITASGFAKGNILELDMKVAKDLFDSKLWLQLYAVKYGAHRMTAQGSITLFSGIVSRKPTKGQLPDTGVAGAIESLGKMLALELAPIRVNVIAPGFIQTPAWDQFMSKEQQESFFESFANTLPLKKIGNAGHVVKAVSFLMDNDYVTGAVIDVDGGQKLI